MAAITELHAAHTRGAPTRQDWTATTLTAALIVAIAVAVGTPIVGLALASLFSLGMWIAASQQRVLLPAEFAAVGVVHAIAVALLAV